MGLEACWGRQLGSVRETGMEILLQRSQRPGCLVWPCCSFGHVQGARGRRVAGQGRAGMTVMQHLHLCGAALSTWVYEVLCEPQMARA